MLQIIEQSDQEKFDMYNKLSKKELIIMLIEANRHLLKPIVKEKQKTYGDVCSCNPANGGSGICHCTIGNNPIRTSNSNWISNNTNYSVNCYCGRGLKVLGESYCEHCLEDNPLLCT